MKKQNEERLDDSLPSADEEFDSQLNAIFGDEEPIHSAQGQIENEFSGNLFSMEQAARHSQPKAFSWVMQSAVYDVKDSLALLQCLLEQPSLANSNVDKTQGDCDSVDGLINERDNSRIMQRELSRIDGDISQLLILYRMETDNLALHIEEVDLEAYLAELVLGNRLLFDLHGVEVEVDCEPELMGFFDPRKVRTVLQSVITAAIKYTQSKLVIRVEQNRPFLRIAILDDGMGYPAEFLTGPAEHSEMDNGTSSGTAASDDQITAIVDNNDVVQSEATADYEGKANLNMYFASRIAELHRKNRDVGFIRIENDAVDSIAGGGSFSILLPA